VDSVRCYTSMRMTDDKPGERTAGPASDESEQPAKLPRGPKGGRTTRTRSGMVRKSLMLGKEEAQALRKEAFLTERSEAQIVREAVRRLLGLSVEKDVERD